MAKKLETYVISKEAIKPSSPVGHLEPFNLSLLDQITPIEYSPLILFYTTSDAHLETSRIPAQLKASLSKTLTTFYPYVGKLKGTFRVHDFHKGSVPFTQVRVKTRLAQFLHRPQIDALNQFLPITPFCFVKDPNGPLFAVQLNIFDCGGVAIGVCFSHMFSDGATMGVFLKAWAANAVGQEDTPPSLREAAEHFTPMEVLPEHFSNSLDSWWNSEAKFPLRRYVFDTKAIASLTAKDSSKLVENPTTNEALSAFIWKTAMAAAARSVASGSAAKPFVYTQAVNVRSLTTPPLPRNSLGNLFWQNFAKYDPAEKGYDFYLHELVPLVRRCLKSVDREYMKKWSTVVFEYIDELDKAVEEGIFFNFHDMRTFKYDDLDFGWGKPVWIGICGEGQDSYCTVLTNGKNGAVEVWMVMHDKIMEEIEKDPEFLAFASSNPSLICAGDEGRNFPPTRQLRSSL